MTGTTLFFVLMGVAAASANLMKLVEWLDTPRDTGRRSRRSAAESHAWSDIAYQSAELKLESAFHAA